VLVIHPSAICLPAIPPPAPLADRARHARRGHRLETGMHHWTLLVKLALGLRTPDIPAGRD